jgi:hypothetical protein
MYVYKSVNSHIYDNITLNGDMRVVGPEGEASLSDEALEPYFDKLVDSLTGTPEGSVFTIPDNDG